MKNDKRRKLSRNRMLVKYHQEHPDCSWSEVGEAFGISKQRAMIIFNSTVEADKRRTT
jgi:predicted transcriptional regulator